MATPIKRLTWHDVHGMWFGTTDPDEVKLARIMAAVAMRGMEDDPQEWFEVLEDLCDVWGVAL